MQPSRSTPLLDAAADQVQPLTKIVSALVIPSPVTAITWAMLLAAVMYWSRFDLNHLPFQIWLLLYFVCPFLTPSFLTMLHESDPPLPRLAPAPAPQDAGETY